MKTMTPAEKAQQIEQRKAKQAAHEAKVAILQARFPTLDISSGYIGNVYGMIDTPAYRDDRQFMLFTNLRQEIGGRVTVYLDGPAADFDVEDVTLHLQNRLVHSLHSAANTLHKCCCNACGAYRTSRLKANRARG